MKKTLLRELKRFLTLIGSRLSRGHLVYLQAIVNYILLGKWMIDHGFNFQNRVNCRQEVWASVAKQVRDRKVCYLEFGVYRGTSMRYWSMALNHAGSRLHGFDSFKGCLRTEVRGLSASSTLEAKCLSSMTGGSNSSRGGLMRYFLHIPFRHMTYLS